MMHTIDPMLLALGADGPDRDLADKVMLFGQFVGAWDMDIRFFDRDGSETKHTTGEWIFGWVLQGRAVQDVLIVPPRTNVTAAPSQPLQSGSTLRYYDPKLDAWRVLFVGAFSNEYCILIARPQGDRIVLEGQSERERFTWTFSEITRDRFLWTGMTSSDGGATWWKEQEMIGTRRA